ncbi:hypothetical protein K402DRAFT_265581 [Aulographum hederae CBS 113979]|uniref:Uncharacterized protein n=1 Tax=Aulographum hederae CBS 113979 TaxID=1176131 RepID=A0A6G1GIS2_9PEZI|nr:hypothetical protein K402DRAFT_265581 [Aulographum hederae CBS 113979]
MPAQLDNRLEQVPTLPLNVRVPESNVFRARNNQLRLFPPSSVPRPLSPVLRNASHSQDPPPHQSGSYNNLYYNNIRKEQNPSLNAPVESASCFVIPLRSSNADLCISLKIRRCFRSQMSLSPVRACSLQKSSLPTVARATSNPSYDSSSMLSALDRIFQSTLDRIFNMCRRSVIGSRW